jgi:hypothetical protein
MIHDSSVVWTAVTMVLVVYPALVLPLPCLLACSNSRSSHNQTRKDLYYASKFFELDEMKQSYE